MYGYNSGGFNYQVVLEKIEEIHNIQKTIIPEHINKWFEMILTTKREPQGSFYRNTL